MKKLTAGIIVALLLVICDLIVHIWSLEEIVKQRSLDCQTAALDYSNGIVTSYPRSSSGGRIFKPGSATCSLVVSNTPSLQGTEELRFAADGVDRHIWRAGKARISVTNGTDFSSVALNGSTLIVGFKRPVPDKATTVAYYPYYGP